MRLIDADALRDVVQAMRERWQDRGYRGVQLGDVLTVLDAAPTIECAACEYDHDCDIQLAMQCFAGCGRFLVGRLHDDCAHQHKPT